MSNKENNDNKIINEKKFDEIVSKEINTKKKLGTLFKTYRVFNDLTQYQVASALGIERSTYTYYETGKTEPTFKTTMKILKILGITYDEFLQCISLPENNEIYNLHDYQENITDNLHSVAKESLYELTYEEQQLLINFRVMRSEDKKEFLESMAESIRTNRKTDTDK